MAAAEAEKKLEALGDRTGLAILDCHWAHLSHLAGDDPEETLRYGERAVRRLTAESPRTDFQHRAALPWHDR